VLLHRFFGAQHYRTVLTMACYYPAIDDVNSARAYGATDINKGSRSVNGILLSGSTTDLPDRDPLLLQRHVPRSDLT